MKPFSFEDFLKEKHAEDYHGTDDNMPDAFDDWCGDLDIQEIMDFADEAVHQAELQGIKRGSEKAEEGIKKAFQGLT